MIYNGYEVIIVQNHDERDPKRTHKKKRINKKYLKRYGVWGKQKLDRGQILIYNNKCYMSRNTYNIIRKEIKNESI